MIAGFSGHVPGLRTEAICGVNFKNSLAEAEATRPRVGNLANVSAQVVKRMPRSESEPGNLVTVADKFPLRHEPSSTRIMAGYSGHVPGKETASWRWVGKAWSKGINHGGSFSSGGSTFENFNPGGGGGMPTRPEPTDSIGGPGFAQSGHPGTMPKHLAAQSWRATGYGFNGYGTRMAGRQGAQEAFVERDARFAPCSGYSGHVRGLVARNIVGRSFIDTVDEARNSHLDGEY